jgi:hypothetical protein
MGARKKRSSRDIEHALLEDADNPDAWEEPITVEASFSSRPSWHRGGIGRGSVDGFTRYSVNEAFE